MDNLRLSSSIKDLKSFNLWQSLFAELVGTFLLAFIGFGSVFSNMNPVKVGLGFGLAGVVIIYCIGPISGGNINPAVSMGLLIARQISLIRFILYFVVQIIGATFGYRLIFILTNGTVLNNSVLFVNSTTTFLNFKRSWSSNTAMNITQDISDVINKWINETKSSTVNISNAINNESNPLSSKLNVFFFDFIKKGINETLYLKDNLIITEKIDKIDSLHLKIFCEMVISFVLVFTVMRLCVEKSRSTTEKGLAPLIIGISITIGVYCGMNISGGSMNPAVSLGKFLCTGSKGITSHIIGPLVGGLLAGVLQQLVFTSDLSKKHIQSYLFSHDFEKEESPNEEKLNDIQLNDVEKTDIETKIKSNRNSQNSEHVEKTTPQPIIENEEKLKETT